MTKRAAAGKIHKRVKNRGPRDIPDQEALLRAILDAEPECVKLVASDGTLLSMNPAGLAMIEADSLDQVKGRSFYPLVAEEHRPAFSALTERVFRGESGTLEFSARGLKGTSRWLETRAVPLRNSTGEIVALLGVTRDITERKLAQEALRDRERLLSSVTENLPGLVSRVDRDLRYLFVNAQYERLFGLPSASIVGRRIPEVIGADAFARFEPNIKRVLAGERVTFESWIKTASGDLLYGRATYVPDVGPDGTVQGLFTMVTDITERKQAEEALRESQRTLSTLISNLPGVVYRCRNDKDWSTEFVSEGILALTGYAPSDLLDGKMAFGQLIHRDDQERVWNDIQTALREKQPYQLVYRIHTAAGEEKWVWEQGMGVFAQSGDLLFLEGFVTDVTERKQAEEQLRAKEAHIQTLVANVPGAVYRCGYAPNWTIEFISEPIRTISGYPASDFINDSVRSYVSIIEPDDWPEVERIAKDRLSRHQPYEVQYRIRHANGRPRWVQEKGQGIFDANGELRWLDGVILDITERKRAEESLKESNRWLRAILDHYPGLISAKDLKGTVILVNRNFSVLAGPSPEEFIGKNVYELFPKEIADELWRNDLAAQQAAGPLESEETVYHKDGSRHTYLTVKFPVREADHLVATAAISVDITERKRAEDALQEAEARLRLAMQAGRIGMWDWNMATGQIIWSRGHEELWGLPPGAFQGTFEEFDARLHPDDRDGLNHAVEQAIAERRMYRHEFRVIWPDGSIHWIAGQGDPVFDEGGKPVRVLGVVMDISERKQAETERERLVHVLDVSLNELYIFDAESLRFEYVNRGAQRNLGYPMEQLREMTPVDLKPEFTDASFRKMLDPMVRRDKDTHVFETVHRRADGTRYPVEVHLQFVEASGRRLFFAVILDITERKRAEAILREHSERLHLLTQRLVQVQEDEARRIGRELHDDLGQILTMLKIKVQTLPRRKGARSFEEQVEDLTMTVDHAIERTRTISAHLRPAILDDLGLEAALRWLLDRQAQQSGLKGVFAVHGIETRVPPELETTCFRVAQEALTNVVRHARAKHVRIELQREGSELHLLVSDDGAGFDATRALSDTSTGKSLGLLGMRERVELMEGRFTIRSAKGTGTVVHAWFSLAHAEPERAEL